MERSYRNLGYVLLVLLPIFVAGFWIPYFSEIPHFDESITMAVHVHAASLFCFLLLLIVQPLAIRYKAFSTHRVLGRFSNILIPIALVTSVAMLWKEYNEHLTDGATHMRCMICIALVLLPAGLARVLGYLFHVRQAPSQTFCLALIDALLLALIVFDRSRRLTARPYILVLLAYIVIEASWLTLGRPI